MPAEVMHAGKYARQRLLCAQQGAVCIQKCVYIPPRSMCDDVISISRCGIDFIKKNAIINAKIQSKKIKFGPSKCSNIHARENSEICCDLNVHSLRMTKTDHEVCLRILLKKRIRM